MLPLFPLGTVLFPGQVLPLHVFEERYRVMVRDLMALPEQEQAFGVVAIREGREVDEDGATALFDVGCSAQVRAIHRHDDGRFDLVAVGARRFRLGGLSNARPYLTGDVEWLDDATGAHAEAAALDSLVREAFASYLDALGDASGQALEGPELPAAPLALGHLVGASMLLDLADRQSLLEDPDGCARLRHELSLLRREAGFLEALRAVPAPELARSSYSAN